MTDPIDPTDLARTAAGAVIHLHYGRAAEANELLADIKTEQDVGYMVVALATVVWTAYTVACPDATDDEIADSIRRAFANLTP